ncbi:hypothetical protein, partial [Rubripirellula obstinata]|uniref:hypothetical protein n=1 Tax=Rubripirellula obstinata TaxID=406547 RepID=UPI001EE4B56F
SKLFNRVGIAPRVHAGRNARGDAHAAKRMNPCFPGPKLFTALGSAGAGLNPGGISYQNLSYDNRIWRSGGQPVTIRLSGHTPMGGAK